MPLYQSMPGADLRGKKSRKSIKLLSAFAADTYASYIFADDRPQPVGFDHSGHGRDADISTATFETNKLLLGLTINKKVVYPFSGADLLASGVANEFTIAAIVKSGSSAYIAGCLYGSETSFGLFQNAIDNGKVVIQNGTTQIASTLNVNFPDAERGNRYEMIAVTASPTERIVYRCFTGPDGAPVMTQSAPSTAAATMGGARLMQSGINAQGSNYAPTFEMPGIAFLTRKLSGAEMAAVFAGLKTYERFYNIAL